MASAEELDALLGALLTPDNDVIQQATDRMKVVCADPSCIPALAQAACAQDGGIDYASAGKRQLAAVLLRQRIVRLWMKVDADTHAALRAALLNGCIAEPVPIVSHSLAVVVSVIAKLDLPANRWPELLPTLYQLIQQGSALQQTVGVYILSRLCDAAGEYMATHMAALIQMLSQTLSATEPESMDAALYAMDIAASLVGHVDQANVQPFRALIPLFCGVITRYVNHLPDMDETALLRSMDVFDSLLDVEELKVSSSDVKSLVEFFMSLMQMRHLGSRTRAKAMFFLQTVAYNRKRLLVKSGLLSSVVQQLLMVMAEETAAEEEEEEEEGETRAAVYASRALDDLAMNLPSEAILATVVPLVQPLVSSANPRERFVAQRALGNLVEGCSHQIGQDEALLSQFVSAVVGGVNDPEGNAEVREAACFTISLLSCHVQPAMCQYTDSMVPVLCSTIASAEVQSNEDLFYHSMFALECFCENLKNDNILPYLEGLMGQMSLMIANGSLAAQEKALCVVAAAAESAGENFAPFYDSVTAHLMSILQAETTIEGMGLRCQATDTLGTLLTAMGPAIVERDGLTIIQLGIDGLSRFKDEQQLRQVTVGLFASIAHSLGVAFTPHMELVMPLLMASAVCQEGRIRRSKDDDEENQVVIDFEDDDDDDEYDDANVEDLPSYIDEKVTAMNALGNVCEACFGAFLPYLEQTIRVIVPFCEHQAAEMRKASLFALGQILRSAIEFAHMCETEGPANVNGAPVALALSTCTKLAIKLVPLLVDRLRLDRDVTVANTVCESLTSVVREKGSMTCLAEMLHPVVETVAQVLQGTVACFAAADDEMLEEDEAEEQTEYEELLMQNSADLMAGLTETYGPAFSEYYGGLLPLLLKHTRKGSSASSRSVAVGTIGDTVAFLGDAVSPHVAAVMPTLLRVMQRDPEGEVRSNAAFASGMLAQYASAAVAPYVEELLKGLYPLFFNQDLVQVTDNACGAVARMFLSFGANIPIAQVLPTLMQALPLKADTEENAPVCIALSSLILSHPAEMSSHLTSVFQMFAHVLADPDQQLPKNGPEAIEKMREALWSVRGQLEGAVMLSEAQVAVLQSLMQSS